MERNYGREKNRQTIEKEIDCSISGAKERWKKTTIQKLFTIPKEKIGKGGESKEYVR